MSENAIFSKDIYATAPLPSEDITLEEIAENENKTDNNIKSRYAKKNIPFDSEYYFMRPEDSK